MRKFYAHRGFRPAWIDQEGPWPIADALLSALRKASRTVAPGRLSSGLDRRSFSRDKVALFREKVPLSRREHRLRISLDRCLFPLCLRPCLGKNERKKEKISMVPQGSGNPQSDGDPLMRPWSQGRFNRFWKALLRSVPLTSGCGRPLLKYQEIDRRGGWPVIPTAPD